MFIIILFRYLLFDILTIFDYQHAFSGNIINIKIFRL